MKLFKCQACAAWQQIELAKHRLFYTILRWNLPLKTTAQDPEHGLSFEFLADAPAASGPKVLTGHDEGKITIALNEANDAEREKRSPMEPRAGPQEVGCVPRCIRR
jgi:hypothetical protein